MVQFFYDREEKVRKLDETGLPIPITRKIPGVNEGDPEIDEPVPGQFEIETKIRRDSFNIDAVIRSHMVNDDHVIVLLNDGHETTEKVPILKNKLKPATPNNIIEEKQRMWVQSEIHLKGKDVKRYYSRYDVE